MVAPLNNPETPTQLLEEAKNNAPILYSTSLERMDDWHPLVILKSGDSRDAVGIPNYNMDDYEKVAGAMIEKFGADEIVFVLEAQCEFGNINSVGLIIIHGNWASTTMWVTKVDVDGNTYSTRNWDGGKKGNVPFDLCKVFDKKYRRELCEGFTLHELKRVNSGW